MDSDNSENKQVCPYCNTVQDSHLTVCINCDSPMVKRYGAEPAVPRRVYIIERLSPLFKIALVLLLLALPTGLIYLIFIGISRTAEKANPYPTDPVETITQFFTALQNEYEPGPDKLPYSSCYNLLSGQRKAATIIGMHDRQAYALHFDRIRNYLVKRIGEDFVSKMEISPEVFPAEVTFDQYITLTVVLGSTTGIDKKSHYNIKEIREFPIDVTPGLGAESYNRGLESLMDSIEGRDKSYAGMGENIPEELRNLIVAYRGADQLDVKHDILDQIINYYSYDQIPVRFLYDIANNEQEAIHLRHIAQQVLDEKAKN